MQNFQMLGALPPDLRASGSGGSAPKATPHYKFLATRLAVAGIVECQTLFLKGFWFTQKLLHLLKKKIVNNFSCMERMLILCKVTLKFYTI